MVMDATAAGEVERLLHEACAFLGGLDVLYHVAGISGRRYGDGALHECSEEGWETTLAANLKSTFLTNRGAVRHFLEERQPGVILNMASVLALAPSPRHFDTCAYAASKGGVIALSRQAAARYGAEGIRVNVLAPGLVDTPMAARAVADPAIRAYLTKLREEAYIDIKEGYADSGASPNQTKPVETTAAKEADAKGLKKKKKKVLGVPI